MIRNERNDVYVGVSNNPQQRLAEHNERRGALYTKRESKFVLVFIEEHADLMAARKREIQIKKWRREKKDKLIEKYEKGLPTNM